MTFRVPFGFRVDPDDHRFAIPETAEAWYGVAGVLPWRDLKCYKLRIDGKKSKPFNRGLFKKIILRDDPNA
ncbi:MAG: hypothetical protein JNL77_08830 [Nitrosomonas sp.]|nr:hypothetical protein [Nitrosomonas sp.]